MNHNERDPMKERSTLVVWAICGLCVLLVLILAVCRIIITLAAVDGCVRGSVV